MPRSRAALPPLALAAALMAACASGRPAPPPPAAPPVAVAVAAPPAPPPDVLLAEARRLRAAGDLDGARSRLEGALAAWPTDEVRLELAEVILADGRSLDRAGALLDAVAARDASRRWLLLGAELAELRGDDVAAAEGYRRALALAGDPDVRLRRALVLERMGQGAWALSELERADRERPGDPVIGERLARRYEAAGFLDEAEQRWKALAEAAPQRPGGWERLSGFYARTGRPALAQAAAARAREAAGTTERALRPLLRAR
ncbi:MAG TPA: hypothetical protein VML50_04290 [Anaeromyxobacter sp.]|nr:hypothetical protein [Anaeromyxobacter sp.]